MTTAEMQVLREDVAGGVLHLALLRIDAELARPEAREWRVVVDDHSQCFWSEAEANAQADWLRTNDAGNVYVDSRTVGPWERAE